MLNKSHIIILILLYFHLLSIFGQELPPIQHYNADQYDAGNQNWSISQNDKKFIYIANNEGLLEFDGLTWTLYPTPNNTILRAVKVINERIYTGSYMDMGYWEKDVRGKLFYTSLIPVIGKENVVDEHIWKIDNYDNYIVFSSLHRIYFFNEQTGYVNIIHAEGNISNHYIINNDFYFSVFDIGLFKLVNGKPKLLLDAKKYNNLKRIKNLFAFKHGFLIVTENEGLFIFENNNLVRWNTAIDGLQPKIQIYCSTQLKNKGIVLGTVANGLFYIDKYGKLVYHLDKNNGLTVNTVLSVFEDKDENIWVGLDNGVNCINNTSFIRIFNDSSGEIGTVYNSKLFRGNLYLGTNQGLFYKKIGSVSRFQKVIGTTGQVWSLYIYDDKLFCGHHKGTFIINGQSAKKISDIQGTWQFRKHPFKKNEILQGNYSGLYVLKKKNNKWVLDRKIKGVDYSVRFFETISGNAIWMNHEYKGVFRFTVDSTLSSITQIKKQTYLKLSRNSGLAKYNTIFYQNKEGVFSLDTLKQVFLKDTILSSFFENEKYITGKINVDDNNKMWLFSKDGLIEVTRDQLSEESLIKYIDLPQSLRKTKKGYENITYLKDNQHLIGTSNGYLILNLNNYKEQHDFTIYLNAVIVKSKRKQVLPISIHTPGTLKYKFNSIFFRFSAPNYSKFQKVKFQYKLEGYDEEWSNWRNTNELRFENLPFGKYTLTVRAKRGEVFSSNEISYQFRVLRPWFISNLALTLYALFFFGILFLMNRIYKNYFNKKHLKKQREQERQILKMKTEKLQKDIDSSNKEMAITMMNIVKRNKLLNKIKTEILESDLEPRKVKSIINLINRNLNSKKDWEKFEQIFNQVDNHFLDRLREKYPDLTVNDMRFCIYLRLKLTSKEIAPLLNISVRSVEIKRYRLRKKMQLKHEESLIDCIMRV